jgi:hypothetical protein
MGFLMGRSTLIRTDRKERTTEPPAGRVRFVRAFATLVLVLAAGAPVCDLHAQAAPEEYQIKAAFLFHFAQLVEWPGNAANGQGRSLILCLYNNKPQAGEILSTLEGKNTGDRILHVHVLDHADNLQGCDIVFFTRNDARIQAAALRALRGRAVLTVGETDSFLSDGGMIRFHLEQDKIRFDIDLAAANNAQLKISSRLLMLATAVIRGGIEAGG